MANSSPSPRGRAGAAARRVRGVGKVTASATSSTPRGEISGAVALKEPEQRLSPAQQLEQVNRVEAEATPSSRGGKARRSQAKGYEGEACGECGNFTLVRNGTCMKCDTCGGTTGCS